MSTRREFLDPLLLLYDAVWAPVTAIRATAHLLCAPSHGLHALAHGLGWVPRSPTSRRPRIWLHAVSVGEVLSIRPVLAELRARLPAARLCVSVGNEPAYRTALAAGLGADAVFHLPWDFSPCVAAALDHIEADVLVLVECELWPNLIARAARRGTRVVMVNARIYDRDLPGYLFARSLFKPLLNLMTAISARSSREAEKFLRLGADASRVFVGGDTKFDVATPKSVGINLRRSPDEFVWILASTHDDEERQILSRLKASSSAPIRVLIAPRRIERAAAVAALAESLGFRTSRWSRGADPAADVIVLDTLGELAGLMPSADAVFVGGTLVPAGGHNPMEPGACGRAVLVGPSLFNFSEAAEAFDRAVAWVCVRDADDLLAHLHRLRLDPAARAALGDRARRLVFELSGATRRCADVIERAARRPLQCFAHRSDPRESPPWSTNPIPRPRESR